MRIRLLLAGTALLAGAGIFFGLERRVPDAPGLPAAGTTPVQASACTGDLACEAHRALTVAGPACTKSVEQLAAYGARWDNADAGLGRFPRSRWLDQAAGTLTFSGAAASFRNGAEAYMTVDYECDYDPAHGAVIETRAHPHPLAS